MNLFKKQKFSIRKFTVGTFSTVIATLAFITHTGHAAELDKHEQTAQHVPTDSNTTGDLAHVASTANNSQTSAEVNKSVDQKMKVKQVIHKVVLMLLLQTINLLHKVLLQRKKQIMRLQLQIMLIIINQL